MIDKRAAKPDFPVGVRRLFSLRKYISVYLVSICDQ